MKRIVFGLFGMFLVLSSYSQNSLLQIKKNVCEYVVDTTLYSQIDFYYSNTSDSAYVLWIERGNVTHYLTHKKYESTSIAIKEICH